MTIVAVLVKRLKKRRRWTMIFSSCCAKAVNISAWMTALMAMTRVPSASCPIIGR